MLTSRLPRLFVLAALISTCVEIAVARDGPASDFSALQEWKNQITAEVEHNKRYLPATRTRGKIGVVKFELNINRSGWVLPGTRIVTADPDLGRVALLLLQQSQPFPAPDNFKVPDSSFRLVASIRFIDIPAPEPAGLQGLDYRKLSECYEADRQELDYQRRRAAYRNAPLPTAVFRTPEGCSEAKRQETERQRSAVEVIK
jgi:hypothetical protein